MHVINSSYIHNLIEEQTTKLSAPVVLLWQVSLTESRNIMRLKELYLKLKLLINPLSIVACFLQKAENNQFYV